jgi:isopentenyl phosphate kinase
MGNRNKLVLIKLGGSVITHKDKPLSPNLRNIRIIGRQLSRALQVDKDLRLILIHGGGSFGHYYAKKFGLSTKISNSSSAEGLARTAAAMIKLHSVVLQELCDVGVYCGTVLPIELFSGIEKSPVLSVSGRNRIGSIFDNHLVPITFGYVNLENSKSYIISGDTIALALVRGLSIPQTIFVMDVDGVFPSSDLKGPVIRKLETSNFLVRNSYKRFDVTGGIRSKVHAGFEIANEGSDVFFVNGSKPPRLLTLFRDSRKVVATRIYSTKIAASYSASQ